MADELFNVVFRGDIVSGHNLADVKARFAQLFKTDIAKVENFFAGRPVVLKANCDRATTPASRTRRRHLVPAFAVTEHHPQRRLRLPRLFLLPLLLQHLPPQQSLHRRPCHSLLHRRPVRHLHQHRQRQWIRGPCRRKVQICYVRAKWHSLKR